MKIIDSRNNKNVSMGRENLEVGGTYMCLEQNQPFLCTEDRHGLTGIVYLDDGTYMEFNQLDDLSCYPVTLQVEITE